jgi:hypothetical protein
MNTPQKNHLAGLFDKATLKLRSSAPDLKEQFVQSKVQDLSCHAKAFVIDTKFALKLDEII